MNYQEAIAYIHSTPKFSRILGNALLKKLLTHLGNPQENLRFIHLAGTNGKGSAAAMTAATLTAAGYKTGLFTSPYIRRFNERITIDGQEIPDDALAALVTRVRSVIEAEDAFVSEFALDTAVGFLWFVEQHCDVVVLETGMGGRLDATNIIEQSLVTVITSIGLDHTQYLGETIEEITEEKCGIIKPAGRVVLYPLQPDGVLPVVRDVCKKMNAQLYPCALPEVLKDGRIRYRGQTYSLSLKGAYQPYNAVTALETIQLMKDSGFDIPDTAVMYGLSHTVWPARFQFVTPRLIVDGGHNIDGIRWLKKSLEKLAQPIVLVTAMMDDKNHRECVHLLSQITTDILVTSLSMPRCCDPTVLASEFCSEGISPRILPDPVSAVKTALCEYPQKTVCVCGSLYLAGEVLKENWELNEIKGL